MRHVQALTVFRDTLFVYRMHSILSTDNWAEASDCKPVVGFGTGGFWKL
jgi:hypothetical protein